MDNLDQTNSAKTPIETKKLPEKKKHGVIFEIIQFIIIAAVIVIPFRLFIAQPFIVNGASMDPTFKNSEYLIVDQISYRFNEPKRESVIIFKYPLDVSKYFIKRIIGLPNETVEIKDGKVTIKNEENPDGFVLDDSFVAFPKKDTFAPVTLKNDEYYVLGDNRYGSLDSRYWGPLNKKYLIGRPIVRLFPVTKIALFPGDLSE